MAYVVTVEGRVQAYIVIEDDADAREQAEEGE